MRSGRVLLVALALAPAAARAEVFEVRPGDDLAARLAALAAGDEVIVHAGTYAAPTLPLVWLGTEDAPIIVRAAPGARPILTGGAGPVLAIAGSHFAVRGFELDGASTATSGVRLGGADHALLDDLAIHGLAGPGITCGAPGADCAFITIRRVELHTTGDGDGLALGCPGAACAFRDALIDGNFLHDLGGAGIVLEGASNVTIRDNVIVRAARAGIAAGGVPASTPPSAIERNLIWAAHDDGIRIAGRVRVVNNIVLGAGGDGLRSEASDGHAPRDLELVNNTVVDAAGACLRARDWAAGANQLVANNALYCEAGAAISIEGAAPAALVANIGRGTSSAPSGFVAGRSVTEDLASPGTGDVYPRAGSPLENAGDGPIAPRLDFDGCVRRGATAEVGAYERTDTGAPVWRIAEAFKAVANCGEVLPDGGAPVAPDMAPQPGGGCCDARGDGGWLALVTGALLLRRRRRG